MTVPSFSMTAEQMERRKQQRAWLCEVLPAGWTGSGSTLSDVDWMFARDFNRKLAAKGWMAPGWPVEWGGMGLDAVSELLWDEELSYQYVPVGNRFQGVKHIGPLIRRHGTEAQKREHLPRITAGEVTWGQGYSEPGSGSDLASLSTRGELDGDHYVINGSKIWTSNAHLAEWIFVLLRTDPDSPKHRGISLMLLPLDSPGVTIQPIANIAGDADFNQVFFEDVQAPKTALLGEENRGWYMAVELLDDERASSGDTGGLRRQLDDLRPFLSIGAASATARHRHANLWIELAAARWLGLRAAWEADNGQGYSNASSATKLMSSELAQRIAGFAVDVLGAGGLLREGSPRSVSDGLAGKRYLWAVMETIGGGASEIQRSIIAMRGLGLPRA